MADMDRLPLDVHELVARKRRRLHAEGGVHSGGRAAPGRRRARWPVRQPHRRPRATAHRERDRPGHGPGGGVGPPEQEASLFTVVVWRGQAEHAAESLTRGSRVCRATS